MPELRSPFAKGFGPGAAADLASMLRVLADSQRLLIISLLHVNGPMAGCDIEPLLGLSQATVSHHLRILADAGLIRSTRERTHTSRELDLDALAALVQPLAQGGAR